MTGCDVQTLLTEGKCFSGACLTPDQQRIIIMQLLCEIVQNGTGTNIYSGIGNPNGVQSATGPAFYFDRTDPLAPIIYTKPTAGVSNNEWIG
jgi:hypothetical protein